MASSTRPWFRLASISRPAPQTEPSPVPAQAQAPPPPLARPTTFRPLAQAQPAPPPPAVTNGATSVPTSQSPRAAPLVPTSPVKASPLRTSLAISPSNSRAAPLSSSVPNSPAKTMTANSPTRIIPTPTSSPARGMLVAASANTNMPSATTIRTFSPKQSPKPINHGDKPPPPPESYRYEPTAPPPSPLTLPPSQINQPKIPTESEPKTMNENPSTWLNSNDIRKKETTTKQANHLNPKSGNRKTDSEQGGGNMRVITIAGENRGAFMEVINSPKKHNNGNYSSSSDRDKNSKNNNNNHKGNSSCVPMKSFMNSNVQGVNNSIVYDSSCTHHDPGVHLALSRKSPFHIKDSSYGDGDAHHRYRIELN